MQGYFESFDKQKIHFYKWDKVENPIGIVQIIHGMAEYAGRYENFAKFLNKKGYIVFADDHRAHGKTAPEGKIGKYDGKNLFYDTLNDEIFISKMLIDKYKLPLYIFGHSYGSFLTQAYIQQCNLYSKAIICGSACMKGRIDVRFGLLVAKITKLFKGKDARAKLIEKINFEGYNKKFKSGCWLNSIDERAKDYYADEFCGKSFSSKFYVDFFGALTKLYKSNNIKNIDENKPILIISGSDDAVGGMGKSVTKLYNFYKKRNKNVKLKLYKGARHEILNDICRDEVYLDVERFLSDNENKK